MVNTVIKEFGSLDILVNNDGIQKESPSHEVTTADFDWVIAVNLRGAYLCARETIKLSTIEPIHTISGIRRL